MQEDITLIYHDDPDGWTSAWLVKKYLNDRRNVNITRMCVNYGVNLLKKIDQIKNTKIYMLDFSIQPYSDFKEFCRKVDFNVIWIDHHKTAIEQYNADPIPIEVCLREGIGACALTYEYLFKQYKLPFWLELIAKYDVWEFPYGDVHHHLITYMWLKKDQFRNLDNNIWSELEKLVSPAQIESFEMIKVGKSVFESRLKNKQLLIEELGFKKVLWNKYRCICVNGKGLSSLPFSRSEKYKDYDIWVTFFYNGNTDKWTVNMYSDKIDVSEIAKRYNGGGHKGAAGFQCDTTTLIDILDI